MKQKIVIKVQMKCEKCKTKTMKIAAGVPGVKSVELTGELSDAKITVIGDVDSILLTNCLRKKVGKATIESVEAVEELPPSVPAIENAYPNSYPCNYPYPFYSRLW